MKLCVIGSTGRTGRHVVEQALAAGDEITAFTRRPHALDGLAQRVSVVPGDGRNPESLTPAVQGANAVIAIIAAESRKGPHHAAEVAAALVSAMRNERVARLVITSAYPIVADHPRIPVAILRRVFAAPYADLRAMEHIVTSSDLDWRIVRLNRLTDGEGDGATELSPARLSKPRSLSRADAAAVLLSVARSDRYRQTALNTGGRA